MIPCWGGRPADARSSTPAEHPQGHNLGRPSLCWISTGSLAAAALPQIEVSSNTACSLEQPAAAGARMPCALRRLGFTDGSLVLCKGGCAIRVWWLSEMCGSAMRSSI